MTQISRFWQGTTIGDSGPYSDDDFAEFVAATLHASARNTSYANRGPIIDSGNAPDVGLQVQATSPASTNIEVLPGAALADGLLYLSDATETLAIAANASGNPRIDTVVITKDHAGQTARLEVLQGTPAATPVPPALTQSAGVEWQIPLADIAVANGFVTITDANITPRHEWANTADGIYVKDVLNNSTVTLQTGDVVVWNGSADRAIQGTTDPNSPYAAGVWVGRTNDGDYGRFLARGIGYVYVTGTVARLDKLYTSSVAFQATNAGGVPAMLIGYALEARTGAGLVLAYIDVDYYDPQSGVRVTKSGTQSVGAGATATVSWDTETFDNFSYHDNVTNNSRLTAPVNGVYAITCYIEDATADSNMDVALQLNGTTQVGKIRNNVAGSVTVVMRLNATQYLEARVTNNTGGARNIATASYFEMELLKRVI